MATWTLVMVLIYGRPLPIVVPGFTDLAACETARVTLVEQLDTEVLGWVCVPMQTKVKTP